MRLTRREFVRLAVMGLGAMAAQQWLPPTVRSWAAETAQGLSVPMGVPFQVAHGTRPPGPTPTPTGTATSSPTPTATSTSTPVETPLPEPTLTPTSTPARWTIYLPWVNHGR